jgi:hypothetical protein
MSTAGKLAPSHLKMEVDQTPNSNVYQTFHAVTAIMS